MPPSIDEIRQAQGIIRFALHELVRRDGSLFIDNEDEVRRVYDDAVEIERKLHEVAINHRFAVYLEQVVRDIMPLEYCVDLEYNRYYYSRKYVHVAGEVQEIRPDILIHTRTIENIYPQHYMAIEAKKGEVTYYDTDKVHGLMRDERYGYVFGATVSYCSDDDCIISQLYSIEENGFIVSSRIEVEK